METMDVPAAAAFVLDLAKLGTRDGRTTAMLSLAGTCFIYDQRLVVKAITAVQRNRLARLGLIGHLDKTKSLGPTGIPLYDNLRSHDVPGTRKEGIQIIRGDSDVQISNVQFASQS